MGRTSFDRGGAPSARRQRGFSFPELLVVIGLIVLLIGILLPAIAGARRQAAIVKCSSNLHQIATASLLHAHDMKGYLPLVGEVAADTWPDQIDSVPIGLNDPYRRRYTYGGGNGSIQLQLDQGGAAPAVDVTLTPACSPTNGDSTIKVFEVEGGCVT